MLEASPGKWPGATDKKKHEEWLPNCTRQVKRGVARRRDEMEHVRGCHTVYGSRKRKGVKFTWNKKGPSAPRQWKWHQTIAGCTKKKKQKNNDGDIRGQQQKDQMELQEHETICRRWLDTIWEVNERGRNKVYLKPLVSPSVWPMTFITLVFKHFSIWHSYL